MGKKKKLSEAEFVSEYFSGFNDGWEFQILEGYAKPIELQDGELRTLIRQFAEVHEKMEEKLKELGYEPG
jgi:hypothetical protein